MPKHCKKHYKFRHHRRGAFLHYYRKKSHPQILGFISFILLGIVLLACFAIVPLFQTTPDRQAYEQAIFDRINEVRIERGILPTVWDEELYVRAQEQCVEMATKGYLCHHDVHSPWGENCYGGSLSYNEYAPSSVTAEGIVDSWLNSPLHAIFLLSAEVKHSAVAVSFDNGLWIAWGFPRYGEPIGYSPWSEELWFDGE